ncbi:hypothetical protein Dimus_038571 [Dionaea muscipula]
MSSLPLTWYQSHRQIHSCFFYQFSFFSMSSTTETSQGTTETSQGTSSLPIVKSISQEISSKLATTNYLVWKMQVLPVLRCHGLLGLVDGTTTRPTGANSDAAVSTWFRLDQMVLAWIASSLSDDALLQVIHCTSARDIWFTLETLYGSVSRSRVQSVKRELHSLSKGTQSVTTYVHHARALARTLALAEDPVSDTDLIFLLLAGLPTEFDSVVAAITLATPLPSLDSVTATLSDFEQRLQRHQSTPAPTVAFVVATEQPSSLAGQTPGRTPSQGITFRRNNNRGGSSRGRGQSARSRNYQRAAPINGDASSIYCYKCGYPNHKANVCEANSSMARTAQAFSALHVSEHADSNWYPDSGASHHMTPDPSLAEGMTAYDGYDSITVGNGHRLPITSTGTVKLSPSLILDKVLIVPKIQKNLLSVSRFTEQNNCCFIFYPSGFLVKDLQTGKTLLFGPTDGALYRVASNKDTAPKPICLQHYKSGGDLWHARLGHPSSQALQLLSSKLQLSSSLNKHVCPSCKLGKSSKLPFDRRLSYSSQVFHTLHSDVWGPSPVISIDGYRYYLSIVDECSLFTWLFPLRYKSEVPGIFIAFLNFIRRQHNAIVKIVQTDGGGEYNNQTLQQFFAIEGISHLMSCPGTPEQNGLAERKHRHIVETGLTLLAHSNLPRDYWSYAFSTAVLLINRLPSQSLSGRIPYTILMGKPADYSLLRVFGCICYPYMQPFGRTKLDYKSTTCIFLGYSSQHKGYRCLDPCTGRIYIYRHVSFFENSFWSDGSSSSASKPASAPFSIKRLPRELRQN